MRRVILSLVKPATEPDADFASVVLLLDFAGSDGATDISDLSNSAHNSETFVNEAEVDTAEQVLAENSLLLGGTGANNEPDPGADLILYANDADWNFGTGDFTVEFHFRQTAAAGSAFIFASTRAKDNELVGTGGWGVDLLTAGFNFLRIVRQSTVIAESDPATFIPVDDTWYHLAFVRSGTDIFFFVDGVQLGDTKTSSANLDNSTSNPLRIGAFNNDQFGLGGSMANVRITKGVGRYTENFTPPTEFYPTS